MWPFNLWVFWLVLRGLKSRDANAPVTEAVAKNEKHVNQEARKLKMYRIGKTGKPEESEKMKWNVNEMMQPFYILY